MADPVLVFRLQFGGGAAEFGDQEQRVVTEALQAAVHVGAGYSAAKDSHVLNQSSAFALESLAGLIGSQAA